MKKILFFFALIITACEAQDFSGISLGSYPQVPDSTIVVIIEFPSQSNEGREDYRRLVINPLPLNNADCYVWYKPNYTTVNDGELKNAQGGINTFGQGGGTYINWGAKNVLLGYFHDITGYPVFLINAARGATGIAFDAGEQDFSPLSTGEAYDVGVDGKIIPGLAAIHALYPTADYNYEYVILFHGAENDATSPGKTSNFSANIDAVFDQLFLDVPALVDAQVFFFSGHYWAQFTDLTYEGTADDAANEVTINTAKQAYCDARDNFHYINFFADTPRDRMYELTTEEKAGVVSGADNAHTSYRGQISKADKVIKAWAKAKNYQVPYLTERGKNNFFYASTYIQPNKRAFRLQFNRPNLTVTPAGGTAGDENKITDVFDSFLSTRDWTVGGSSSARLKVQNRKGGVWFPPATSEGDTRITSPSSLPNQIFNDGSFVWSIGGWAKFEPNTGSGGNPDQAILSTNDVYAGTRSRVLVYKTNVGKLRVDVNCNSSTTKSALTNLAVFNATANTCDADFIHWTVTSDGTNIKIFINGVEQALDAVSNGSLSGITPTNFFNNTNGIVIGERQTGASTFDFGFMGEMREVFGYGGIALTASQILEIMKN